MTFDVYQTYKPLRNKIGLLSVEDSLAVVWAYCQYLQIDDFQFPKGIEVGADYFKLEVHQTWIESGSLSFSQRKSS
jgi:hypothetical protein